MVSGEHSLQNSFFIQREGRVYSAATFFTLLPNTIWHSWLTAVLSVKLRSFRLWGTIGGGLFFATNGTIAAKYNFKNVVLQGFVHRAPGNTDEQAIIWRWKGSIGYKFGDRARLTLGKLDECWMLSVKRRMDNELNVRGGLVWSFEKGPGVNISMSWP
jgi:hypothetical protein